MLDIVNIKKTYNTAAETITAVDDVTLDVQPGQIVVVRGPSGCGKYTLLLMAGGLLSPTSGTIHIDGVDPYSLGAGARASLRAAKLGYVFQQFHLIPYLTVLENVISPIMATGKASQQRAEELIETVGLTARINHLPNQLSTGERQRTAIARAMLHDPRLILADEPTGNLDEDNGRTVLNILRSIADHSRAVMMVTHDAAAENIADRVIRMSDGKIWDSDPT